MLSSEVKGWTTTVPLPTQGFAPGCESTLDLSERSVIIISRSGDVLRLLERIYDYIGAFLYKKAEGLLATEAWYSFPPVRSGKILRFEVKNFGEFDVAALSPPLAEP